MRHTILATVLTSIIGCGDSVSGSRPAESQQTKPVQIAAKPVDEGFTSDEDLVKFKDQPGLLAGKSFKVRATYFVPSGHAPDYHGEYFRKQVKVNGSNVTINIVVDFGKSKLPVALMDGELYTVEFTSKNGETFRWNNVTSICR